MEILARLMKQPNRSRKSAQSGYLVAAALASVVAIGAASAMLLATAKTTSQSMKAVSNRSQAMQNANAAMSAIVAKSFLAQNGIIYAPRGVMENGQPVVPESIGLFTDSNGQKLRLFTYYNYTTPGTTEFRDWIQAQGSNLADPVSVNPSESNSQALYNAPSFALIGSGKNGIVEVEPNQLLKSVERVVDGQAKLVTEFKSQSEIAAMGLDDQVFTAPIGWARDMQAQNTLNAVSAARNAPCNELTDKLLYRTNDVGGTDFYCVPETDPAIKMVNVEGSGADILKNPTLPINPLTPNRTMSFRRIIGEGAAQVSVDGDNVKISVAAREVGAVNTGTGIDIYNGNDAQGKLQFRKLAGAGGIAVRASGDGQGVEIDASSITGSVNNIATEMQNAVTNVQNLSAGQSIISSLTAPAAGGRTLTMRTVQAGSGIALSGGLDQPLTIINTSPASAMDAVNVGGVAAGAADTASVKGLFAGKDATDRFMFKRLEAGNGVTLGDGTEADGQRAVRISINPVTSGLISDGFNLGTTGAEIFARRNGANGTLEFRRLAGVTGGGVDVIPGSGDNPVTVRINAAEVRTLLNLPGSFVTVETDPRFVAAQPPIACSPAEVLTWNGSQFVCRQGGALMARAANNQGTRIVSELQTNTFQSYSQLSFRTLTGNSGIRIGEGSGFNDGQVTIGIDPNYYHLRIGGTNASNQGISLFRDVPNGNTTMTQLNGLYLKTMVAGNGVTITENAGAMSIALNPAQLAALETDPRFMAARPAGACAANERLSWNGTGFACAALPAVNNSITIAHSGTGTQLANESGSTGTITLRRINGTNGVSVTESAGSIALRLDPAMQYLQKTNPSPGRFRIENTDTASPHQLRVTDRSNAARSAQLLLNDNASASISANFGVNIITDSGTFINAPGVIGFFKKKPDGSAGPTLFVDDNVAAVGGDLAVFGKITDAISVTLASGQVLAPPPAAACAGNQVVFWNGTAYSCVNQAEGGISIAHSGTGAQLSNNVGQSTNVTLKRVASAAGSPITIDGSGQQIAIGFDPALVTSLPNLGGIVRTEADPVFVAARPTAACAVNERLNYNTTTNQFVCAPALASTVNIADANATGVRLLNEGTGAQGTLTMRTLEAGNGITLSNGSDGKINISQNLFTRSGNVLTGVGFNTLSGFNTIQAHTFQSLDPTGSLTGFGNIVAGAAGITTFAQPGGFKIIGKTNIVGNAFVDGELQAMSFKLTNPCATGRFLSTDNTGNFVCAPAPVSTVNIADANATGVRLLNEGTGAQGTLTMRTLEAGNGITLSNGSDGKIQIARVDNMIVRSGAAITPASGVNVIEGFNTIQNVGGGGLNLRTTGGGGMGIYSSGGLEIQTAAGIDMSNATSLTVPAFITGSSLNFSTGGGGISFNPGGGIVSVTGTIAATNFRRSAACAANQFLSTNGTGDFVCAAATNTVTIANANPAGVRLLNEGTGAQGTLTMRTLEAGNGITLSNGSDGKINISQNFWNVAGRTASPNDIDTISLPSNVSTIEVGSPAILAQTIIGPNSIRMPFNNSQIALQGSGAQIRLGPNTQQMVIAETGISISSGGGIPLSMGVGGTSGSAAITVGPNSNPNRALLQWDPSTGKSLVMASNFRRLDLACTNTEFLTARGDGTFTCAPLPANNVQIESRRVSISGTDSNQTFSFVPDYVLVGYNQNGELTASTIMVIQGTPSRAYQFGGAGNAWAQITAALSGNTLTIRGGNAPDSMLVAIRGNMVLPPNAAIPTCGAGQVLTADGTTLSCVADQNSSSSFNAAQIGSSIKVATNLSGNVLVDGATVNTNGTPSNQTVTKPNNANYVLVKSSCAASGDFKSSEVTVIFRNGSTQILSMRVCSVGGASIGGAPDSSNTSIGVTRSGGSFSLTPVSQIIPLPTGTTSILITTSSSTQEFNAPNIAYGELQFMN